MRQVKLMVAGLVHDRPTWPLWLRHLDALEAGGHELVRLHVVDAVGFGRERNTGDLSWCPVPRPRLVVHDLGPIYHRHDRQGVQDGGPDDPRRPRFERMARLRNRMVQAALEANVDALVNIDSDIMAPPDLILRLADGGYSWIAAVVSNDQTNARNCNVVALLTSRNEHASIVHLRPREQGGGMEHHWPGREVFAARQRPVMVVGAVCWYSADMLRRGARFQGHLLGEDIGFGLSAASLGYDGRYIGLRCEHLMYPEDVERHRRECPLCAGS